MKRKRFQLNKVSRVSNRLERRKPSNSKEFSRLATLAGKETKKPFLRNGELIIPSDSDDKYRYWAGGQSIFNTLLELGAPDEVIEKYIDPILTATAWKRWCEMKQAE